MADAFSCFATPSHAATESCDRCPVKTVLALRTALAYAAIAAVWIAGGDWLLLTTPQGAARPVAWVVTKGAVFVLVTTALLYALLRRHARRCEAATAQWRAALQARHADAERLQGERAKAEAATSELGNAEVRLRILLRAVEQSPVSIVITDTAGRIDYVNPKFTQITGYSFDEVIGLNPRFLKSGETTTEDYEKLWTTILAGREWKGEFHNQRKNGDLFWESVTISPILDRYGRTTHFVAVKEDITARKAASRALQASEERFREVVETIAEVFWVFDPSSDCFSYFSPSFEKIWGRGCDDACGPRTVWMQAMHPGDRDRVIAALRETLNNAKYDEQYRIVRPDGVTRWIRDQAFPVQNASGQVTRVVGVAEDITEKKEIERQFLRAQRLEAIGTLASGIAHDMNNILAPMIVAPALLKDRLRDPADRQLLVLVEQSAQRGAGIVRQLLTFSRGTESEKGPVQIGHLVREMLNIMRETFPREIDVRCDTIGELPEINCDPTQIHQVLMNLCVNARDAMPHGGRLKLRAEPLDLDDAAGSLHPAARAGHYVKVSVEDTGHGIPPEIIECIFDPFFTTKELGKGTGLGLSTVLGIVNSHEGFVLVESAEGRGSVFKVFLPAVAAGTQAPTVALPAPSVPGRGELILVVDDEESLREATRLLLEKRGYDVVLAGDGREALARFSSTVRLVLTDMMMPTMNGFAFIRALRGRAPDVPIVATTGLGDSMQGDILKDLGVHEILRKPYLPNDLLRAVQASLSASVAA